MSEDANAIGRRIRAYCQNCKGHRNCEIKGFHKEAGGDEFYDWQSTWHLLICCGCDHVFAQVVHQNSDSVYYDDDGDEVLVDTIVTMPARSKRDRPVWFENGHLRYHNLATDLNSVLREAYTALDSGLSLLAAVGARTAFWPAAGFLDTELRCFQ